MSDPENRKGTGDGRTSSGQFAPGTSGNKGGRPKIPDALKAKLTALEPKAWQALEDIIEDPIHKDREKAAEYVINRIHGKPLQKEEVSGPEGGPVRFDVTRLSLEELKAFRSALIKGKTGDGG